MSKELEALRDICQSSHCVSEPLRKDLKPFEVTERKNIIHEALKRNEPMKPEKFRNTYDLCPTCAEILGETNYCPTCGQKIDWE